MCQGSKGKGSEFRHETAREGEGRRGAFPLLLPRAPFVLPMRPYPLSLPFGILQSQSKLLGHFLCLLVPSMLVYKVWWLNHDKQLWEGQGEHEKAKNSIWSEVSQLFLSETVVAQNLILTFLLTIISRQSAALILSASSSSNRHSICRMIQFCVYSTANFTQSRYPVSVSSVCSARRRWTEAWDTDKK